MLKTSVASEYKGGNDCSFQAGRGEGDITKQEVACSRLH